MASFFESVSDVWGYVEPWTWFIVVFLGTLLFLSDQVRRTRFVGLIPTVITVVFDPTTKQVLLGHLNHGRDRWILPQGEIRGSIVEAAEKVLFQEVNLQRSYKVRGLKSLGFNRLRNEERERLRHLKDNADWSSPVLWGKSYTALFAIAQMGHVQTELNGAAFFYDYDQVRFVSLAEARELLSQKHRPEKVQVYMKVLKQLEREF